MPKTILVPPVPNRELTAAARAALKTAHGKIILFLLIFFIIQGGISVIHSQFPWLLGIAWAVQAALSIGFARFFLQLARGQAPSLGTIGHALPLPRFGTAVAAMILVVLRVFLWSLLFLIPGIIAFFNYLMVYYILAEDRQCTAREAIRRSCALMYGHRWQYFRLQLRLLGGLLLLYLAGVIVAVLPWLANLLIQPSSPVMMVIAVGITLIVALAVFVVVFFWWVPYCNLATAAFYNSILPAKMPEPTPELHPELTPVTETSPIIGAEPILTVLPPEPAPESTTVTEDRPEYSGMPVWQTVLLLVLLTLLSFPSAFFGKYAGTECSKNIRLAATLRLNPPKHTAPDVQQFLLDRLFNSRACPNSSGERAQYFDATPFLVYSQKPAERSRQPVLIELPGNHWGLLFHIATADGQVHVETATEPGLEAYQTLLTAKYETSPALLNALTEHYNQTTK